MRNFAILGLILAVFALVFGVPTAIFSKDQADTVAGVSVTGGALVLAIGCSVIFLLADIRDGLNQLRHADLVQGRLESDKEFAERMNS